MKKTDTCYYMSITKEENSAFVVANHQGGGTGDPTQVVIDSKGEGSTTTGGGASATGTAATTITSTTTPTATLSASIAAAGGNGTTSPSIGRGAIGHQRHTNCYTVTCDTSKGHDGLGDARVKGRSCTPMTKAPMPPPVILQVLPSTPTFQHHNLLASDVHRECRMRLCFVSYFLYLFFVYFSFLFIFLRSLCLTVCDTCTQIAPNGPLVKNYRSTLRLIFRLMMPK